VSERCSPENNGHASFALIAISPVGSSTAKAVPKSPSAPPAYMQSTKPTTPRAMLSTAASSGGRSRKQSTRRSTKWPKQRHARFSSPTQPHSDSSVQNSQSRTG
jgi:hypothetical protein